MIEKSKEPIFRSIFGCDWEALPPVLKKHYANTAFSEDETIVDGELDLMCKGPVKLFAPVFWLLKGIPPHNEQGVQTNVRFLSNKHTAAFHFYRSFKFKKRKPYIFHSRMVQIENNIVAEIMPFRLCWIMTYDWENEAVHLRHKGYALHIFKRYIPLPLKLFLGEGYAKETAIDDHHFEMETNITHPIWGKIYEYKGRFKVR